jgi:hypothetical protein
MDLFSCQFSVYGDDFAISSLLWDFPPKQGELFLFIYVGGSSLHILLFTFWAGVKGLKYIAFLYSCIIWVPPPPPPQASLATPLLLPSRLRGGIGDPNHTTVQKRWYSIYYTPFRGRVIRYTCPHLS